MAERLTTPKRVLRAAGASLGMTAVVLSGCSSETPVSLEEKRDAIAQLYDKCELVDVEKTTSTSNRYTEQFGYDALKLTANVNVSPEAEKYRVEFENKNDIIWGAQSVRLQQYGVNKNGTYQQYGHATFRGAELPTQSTAGATFEMYPAKTLPDGMVFGVFIGNTAISRPYTDHEVSAAVPCGSVVLDVEDGKRNWKILDDGPELKPIGLEATDHGPINPDQI